MNTHDAALTVRTCEGSAVAAGMCRRESHGAFQTALRNGIDGLEAPGSGSAARRRSTSSNRTGAGTQNMSSGPGCHGVSPRIDRCESRSRRAPRWICCQRRLRLQRKVRRRPVAAWRVCQRSTVPSLFVSTPNCAFRLTTWLTSGVAVHPLGSTPAFAACWWPRRSVARASARSAGWPGVAACPEIDQRCGDRRCTSRAVVAGRGRQRVGDRRDAGPRSDRDARRIDDRQRARSRPGPRRRRRSG